MTGINYIKLIHFHIDFLHIKMLQITLKPKETNTLKVRLPLLSLFVFQNLLILSRYLRLPDPPPSMQYVEQFYRALPLCSCYVWIPSNNKKPHWFSPFPSFEGQIKAICRVGPCDSSIHSYPYSRCQSGPPWVFLL